MKVLALSAEAWGGLGGIAKSTCDLLSALHDILNPVEMDVLTRVQKVSLPDLPRGIVQHPPKPNKLAYSVQALWFAATRRPDVVYCGHAFMAQLAHLAAKLAGAKLVAHVHGLEVWEPISVAARNGLKASDLVLCVSQHTKAKVIETTGVDPAKCATIYNTVDARFVPTDRAKARAQFGIPESAIVLSTVSRLDPQQRHKGHDRIIPLLGALRPDVPGLTYLIAGTGGDQPRLVALADDCGVTDMVRFLGFVADDCLPHLYTASDLYVMPSHGEGFGIAFIEAMACGTHALGLDVGGAPDALRDGDLGRAVSENDFPIAFRKAVKSPPPCRSDLSARTHATFGRARFLSRLSEALAPVLNSPVIKTQSPKT